MKTLRVRDVMAQHYTTLQPEQSLASAVARLLSYRQSAAPVVEQQRLIGILSEADCVRATLLEGYFNEGVALVKDQMNSSPETISPEAEIATATEAFLKDNRRMMPVVEAGVLVGILTRENILKSLLEAGEKKH